MSRPNFSAIGVAITHTMAYFRDKVGTLASGHASALAKPVILSLLSRIHIGTLTLIDETSGECHVFGQPYPPTGNPPCVVTLTIHSPQFYLRVLLHSDMGFAAAYMLHQVSCSDLTAFFRLFILNRDALNNGFVINSSTGSAQSLPTTAAVGNKNTMEGAAVNIAAHYDLGNDIFAAFLSPDMTYSCPIWETVQGPPPGQDSAGDGESLESAQLRKLHHIISAARIKSSDHVLEIGTGWGSFAIEAVKTTGCRVTTLTLSRQQKRFAEERVAREGLADRVKVLLMDYRDEALPVPEGGFDKVVSIEMLEAVGREFLGTYFARVDKVLKRDGGIAVFQCITMPEGRHAAYEKRKDFINYCIFPGGYLPSITQLLNHIAAESQGTFIVEKVENVGAHYVRTLRLWREKFLANFEDKICPALLKKHTNVQEADVKVFRRKWQYYFAYCEAGFLTKVLGDVIISVGREGAMDLMEGIPL
ncbi:cyclopropane-fatty-acyl-phospholipid synthase [Parathielavia appendiculata]|uniref:Cyclopropane-fatty-acyl-phospholipid synthase n=1 Tax=Parathielavia appendiculata TaxID=2587402 RepID=A0AAN6U2Y2_9PEZI|nr:cyclopropane-fatty-acyl-phospholipid synthase [Parathielavia appendiculata]